MVVVAEAAVVEAVTLDRAMCVTATTAVEVEIVVAVATVVAEDMVIMAAEDTAAVVVVTVAATVILEALPGKGKCFLLLSS